MFSCIDVRDFAPSQYKRTWSPAKTAFGQKGLLYAEGIKQQLSVRSYPATVHSI